MFSSFFNNRRRGRTIVNGRLDRRSNHNASNSSFSFNTTTTASNIRRIVYDRYFRLFSPYRFIMITTIVALLWFTNPSNKYNFINSTMTSNVTTTIEKQFKQFLLSLSLLNDDDVDYDTKNNNRILYDKKQKQRQQRQQRSLTNYGFFSIRESYNELSLVGLGGYDLLTIQCDYHNTNSLTATICIHARDILCHQGPLLYHSTKRGPSSNNNNNFHDSKRRRVGTINTSLTTTVFEWFKTLTTTFTTTFRNIRIPNRPYTFHRFLCWTMIIGALLTLCYHEDDNDILRYNTTRGANSFWTIVWESWYTILIDTNKPLQTALLNCISSSIFIYPTLSRMDQIVPIQSPRSVFRVFDSLFYSYSYNGNADDIDFWNYVLSVVTLFLLAIGINALSKIWSKNNICTLQFHSLTAVAFGYYRGSIMFFSDTYNNHANDFVVISTSDGLPLLSISVQTATWIMIFWMYLSNNNKNNNNRSSSSPFIMALLWTFGNILGAEMGQYQTEHIYYSYNTIVSSINGMYNTVMEQLYSFLDR